MALIEQAVFTSAETDRSAGYQIVAASPGLGEADLRELAAWGPSHGSLVDPSPDGVSFNFHPLQKRPLLRLAHDVVRLGVQRTRRRPSVHAVPRLAGR